MSVKKQAFTLAEILIALTIIGIVAAVTVPMLMSNTNARTNRLKVQKAYTTLSTALRMGQTKLDFDMSDVTSVTGTGDVDTVFTIENFLTKTMDVSKTANGGNDDKYPFTGKPLKIASNALAFDDYGTSGVSKNATVFKSRDGIYYIFPDLSKTGSSYDPCTKDTPCIGYIDINGPKDPNEVITCTGGTDALWTKDADPAECSVDESAISDIYPFVMYGATVKPATSAFDAVLAE